MASVTKFKASAVRNILAHNARLIQEPSNKDIDASRSEQNYSLLDRGQSAYDYYWARKQELHCLHRDDVKPLCGWVLTAPKELPIEMQNTFFKATFDFVSARYGEINMVQAIVHMDESGQPHLHVCFIPATPDLKHGGEKICANDVITRKDLITFHTDWQEWLCQYGIDTPVRTGITKAQGGNLTVSEMKQQRDIEVTQHQEVHPAAEHDRWVNSTSVEITKDIDNGGRW